MRVAIGAIHRGLTGFPGLGYGLGACMPLGYSYSNTPNGACEDGTGSVVDCRAASCSVAAPVQNAPAGPNFQPNTQEENISIPGFTGTFAVPTLDADLSQFLFSNESPFIANMIAKGGQADGAADFLSEAQSHCADYPSSAGCNNWQALANQYAAQYAAWLKGQSASVYQSGDTGSLYGPTIPVAAVPVIPSAPLATPSPVTTTPAGSTSTPLAPGPGGTIVATPAGGSPLGTPAGSTTGGFNLAAFLQEKSFPNVPILASIPNWGIGLAALAGIFVVMRFTGGRR